MFSSPHALTKQISHDPERDLFVSSCQPADVELLNNNTLIQKWRNVINHKNRYRQPIYHKKVIMKIGLLAMWLTGNNISSSSCLAM